jgi:hypothetical protein
VPGSDKKWLGYLIGTGIVGAILFWMFGPIGILYTLGYLAFLVFSEIITKLIKPQGDPAKDPTYQKNVRDLIARSKQFEEKAE